MRFPRFWLPWTDLSDEVSFTKLLITALTIAIFMRIPLPTTISIVLIAAAFGKSTFEKFLMRSQFQVSDVTQRNIQEGYEPTP